MPIGVSIREGDSPAGMILDLDGNRPHELTIANHVLRGLFYEPEVSRLFTQVLEPGDRVIDVGANIGYFAMLAASLVGGGGKVLAFEPDPSNISRLHNNRALNGFEQVEIIERAALDEIRAATFFPNASDSGGSALWDPTHYPHHKADESDHASIDITGTTIDAEVERTGLTGIKLIKVDTEGADYLVLKGARRLLETRSVPFVLCELHEFGLQQMGSSQEQFRAYMAGFGYDSFMLYFDNDMPRLVPHGTRIVCDYLCNILFSTPEAVGRYWRAYRHSPGDLYSMVDKGVTP